MNKKKIFDGVLNYNNLLFLDAELYENYLYFSAANCNGLFELNLKNGGKTRFVASFPGNSDSGKLIHRRVVKMGQQLLFLPFFGKGMHFYDLDNGDLDYYEIKSERKYDCWSNCFIFDDKVILLPFRHIESVFIFHLRERKGEFIELVGIDEEDKMGCSPMFLSCLSEDGIVYYTYENNKNVKRIDIKTFHVSDYIELAFTTSEMRLIDNRLWVLSSDRNKIACYGLESRKMILLHDFCINNLAILDLCGILMIYERNYLKAWIFDSLKGDFISWNFDEKYLRHSRPELNLLGEAIGVENTILICPMDTDLLMALDANLKVIDSYPIKCPDEYLDSLRRTVSANIACFFEDTTVIQEGQDYSYNLKNMLAYLLCQKG